MKVLVTGSSGHLGEAIMRLLIDKGIDCLGLDIISSAFTDKVGSIADRKFVKENMCDITAVIHTATLHKPHIVTHSNQDFIDTNITGTLNLLEEANIQGCHSLVFTSSTSAFGDALTPHTGHPAVWVTEELTPIPKNIYGATKLAAEDLCKLFYRNHQLPCLILKTSRFFQSADEIESDKEYFSSENIKANEFLNRRVDIEDVANAHLLAMKKASEIGFGKYIISATTPFSQQDLVDLRIDTPRVVERLFPDYKLVYKSRNWKMWTEIDRVYVNAKAKEELGWKPKYDFRNVLDCLKENRDFRSDLAKAVGKKNYLN